MAIGTNGLMQVSPEQRAQRYAEKVREEQRKVNNSIPALLRYMRGQRVLYEWMCFEYPAVHNAQILLEHSASPQALYKKLENIGYTWDSKARLWKLRRGYTMPIFTVKLH